MTDNLSISVVIVTRNRAHWLKEAMDSLIRQTRQPEEVIVVDNDSQDNTKEVALEYNNKLNLKYVSEMTRGVPYARNAGINNAAGDIVVFLDDDCVANEDWLKNMEKPFIKDPNVGAVGGNLSYAIVEDGSTIEEFYVKNMAARKNNKK